MGLFDLFNKKKSVLTEEQLKWNKMWDLWEKGEIESPYAELMTYQSEVYNGGHAQYFDNVGNVSDLQEEMSALAQILPTEFNNQLKKAYKAYLVLEENDENEEAEIIIEQCDDMFYENEEEINHILEDYAVNIEL